MEYFLKILRHNPSHDIHENPEEAPREDFIRNSPRIFWKETL